MCALKIILRNKIHRVHFTVCNQIGFYCILIGFISFLSLFAFFSTPDRTDRQKLTIEKFRIAKISIVIGDHFIHSLVRHSLVRFVFFSFFSFISHIFELPVGFYWHRSSIRVQDWLSLHHTFSSIYNNVLLPSSSLPFSQCSSLHLQPFVVHRLKKEKHFPD